MSHANDGSEGLLTEPGEPVCTSVVHRIDGEISDHRRVTGDVLSQQFPRGTVSSQLGLARHTFSFWIDHLRVSNPELNSTCISRRILRAHCYAATV